VENLGPGGTKVRPGESHNEADWSEGAASSLLDLWQIFSWREGRGSNGFERNHVKELQQAFSKRTVKQHLADARMLFDRLLTGQSRRSATGGSSAVGSR
jgi:hypothetical protein